MLRFAISRFQIATCERSLERVVDVIFDDFFDHRRVGESCDVTEIVRMSGRNFPENPAHDFSGSSFREAGAELGKDAKLGGAGRREQSGTGGAEREERSGGAEREGENGARGSIA